MVIETQDLGHERLLIPKAKDHSHVRQSVRLTRNEIRSRVETLTIEFFLRDKPEE